MEQHPHTLLIDGSSLLMNSFEATIKTPEYEKGHNGTYLFLSRLRTLLESNSYTHIKCAFDGDDSATLRQVVYPDYKFKRKNKVKTTEEQKKSTDSKKQKEDIKFILSHIASVYEDPCVEGDDVIAAYIRQKGEGERVTIVTGDFDVLQMISSTVNVYYLNKKFKTKTRTVERYEKDEERKNLVIDFKNFKKTFGFPYENIVIIKTICGDDSDEIKNIKGVKEQSLFNAFPYILERKVSLEEIIEDSGNFLTEKIVNIRKTKQRIFEGETDGSQGKDILSINKRIVDLSNEEFITKECLFNLKETGFFSTEKFVPKESVLMIKKMSEIGLLDAIKAKYNTLNHFLKPFFKTLSL